MYYPAAIVKHLRLLLTAITLLLVVGLNNREVTTFAAAPAKSSEQQVNKAVADQHDTVKQKVSFEATYGGILLPPATLLPAIWQDVLEIPDRFNLSSNQPAGLGIFIFRLLLATAISPNAP